MGEAAHRTERKWRPVGMGSRLVWRPAGQREDLLGWVAALRLWLVASRLIVQMGYLLEPPGPGV